MNNIIFKIPLWKRNLLTFSLFFLRSNERKCSRKITENRRSMSSYRVEEREKIFRRVEGEDSFYIFIKVYYSMNNTIFKISLWKRNLLTFSLFFPSIRSNERKWLLEKDYREPAIYVFLSSGRKRKDIPKEKTAFIFLLKYIILWIIK